MIECGFLAASQSGIYDHAVRLWLKIAFESMWLRWFGMPASAATAKGFSDGSRGKVGGECISIYSMPIHKNPRTCTPTNVIRTSIERRSGAVSFLPHITITSKGFTRRRGCRNGKKCGLILLSGLLSLLGGHRSRKNKFAHVYILLYTYMAVAVTSSGVYIPIYVMVNIYVIYTHMYIYVTRHCCLSQRACRETWNSFKCFRKSIL